MNYPTSEGYDYKAPGGCDYRGDPNYPMYTSEPLEMPPPFDPLPDYQQELYRNRGFPPGYTGGWDPHGPPIDVDYEWRPYGEGSSSHMED